MDLETLTAKMIETKLGYSAADAAELARDFRDDFRKNGIRTAGQAIGYLEPVLAQVLENRRTR